MSYKGKTGLGTDQNYSSSIYYKYEREPSNPLPPPETPVYAIDSNTIYALNDGTPIEVI